MATWKPVAGLVPQYQKSNGDNASGYYLQFEAAGTSTSINLATDDTGGTQLARIQLNSSGKPETAGGAEIVPHIDQMYKVTIYPTLADAQAKTNPDGDPIDNLRAIGDADFTNNVFFAENYTTLALATTAAAGKKLVVSTAIASDSLTATGLTIEVIQGGSINANSGKTITLNCDIDAGNYKIFNGAGTIAGTFSNVRQNVYWYTSNPVTDIGAAINAITAAGYLHIFIPTGTYTQATTLTLNQEVYLYAPHWDEVTKPPVIIQKSGNFVHIETTSTFVSMGIEWDGASVAGGADGIVCHHEIYFVGRVIGQTGSGLVCQEKSAGQNLNNNYVAGAFAGNTESQLLVETSHLTDSDALDINTLLFGYIRCNTGRFGLHVKAGLYNDYSKVSTKGNSEVGVFIESDNDISNNNFRVYSENTASDSIDIWVVDGWADFGGSPTRTGATTFTVTGDQTATFPANRKIKCLDNSVKLYGTVVSSVFSSVTTVTVSLFGTTNVLTSNLTLVSTDAGNNNFRDSTFSSVRADGFTASDIYTGNGNKNEAGGKGDCIATNAFQPWVFAYLASDALNKAGLSATNYTIAYDTEIKDVQVSFNTSTSTFAAPITGAYGFGGGLRLQGLGTSAHGRMTLTLITTDHTYTLVDIDLDAVASSSNVFATTWNVPFAPMGSTDTAIVRLNITGSSDDVDISGGAGQTFFMARLLG